MKLHNKKRPRLNANKIEVLEAKTPNQKDYIRSIIENDIIFCTGPAGSGKSFIPAGISSQHLHTKQTENILVTRPLVCAGKDIGSMPGDTKDKIAPYLLPMEENLKFFLGRAFYGHYFNSDSIKYFPLELMRGSTFHNTYMILDEAQNCTVEQIKMFITRMGKFSKVIINGDVKQTDLRGNSGLDFVIDRCRHIEGVAVCELTYDDIQRNGIIGDVLMALEN
jgi:phosphate starvation-inducible PhoH-like protein